MPIPSHKPESNGNPVFVYKGTLKKNINSAGETLRQEKKFRIAVIIAGTALFVLIGVMTACIIHVSPSARERRVIQHVKVVQQLNADVTDNADTLRLPETSVTE